LPSWRADSWRPLKLAQNALALPLRSTGLWICQTCPEHSLTPILNPDTLILADPKEFWNFSVALNEAIDGATLENWKSDDLPIPAFRKDKTYVWSKADFDGYIAETRETGRLLHYLTLIVDPKHGGAGLHQMLTSEPRFQRELSQLRQDKSDQEERQRLLDEYKKSKK
jgi:hypothetical protein